MSAIQFVLVVAAVIWLSRFLRGSGAGTWARLVGLLAGLAGIVLILFPDLSVRLARLFGVTRGVDLVLYLSVVTLGFLWLHQAMRVRELESRVARLVREKALDQSTVGAASESGSKSASS